MGQRRRLALALAFLASGCSALTGFGDLSFDRTGGVGDSAAMDAGTEDDASGRDLGTSRDSGRDTGGPIDSGRDSGRDGGPPDGGPRDSGPTDTGPTDTGPGDMGTDPGSGGCEEGPSGTRTITRIGSEPGTADRPGVIAYRVSYMIDGLRIYGQICVPMSPGPHAAVVYNHHGTNGLMDQWGVDGGIFGLVPNICTYVGRRNAVAIMPQYRGQSDAEVSSAGAIEYCAGEVTDAEALAQIAMERCDIAPGRVTAVGYDHGGCVTLQMVHRAVVPLAAAAVVAAPSDLAALHAKWVIDPARMADLANLELWVGNPTDDPAAFEARSPLLNAAAIVAADVPLMIVHGTQDDVVPIQQSCDLRSAMGSAGIAFTNFHVNLLGNAVTDRITQCSADSATYITPWPPASPTRFSGPNYFLAFEQGHAFDVARGFQASEAYIDFVLAHVGPL